MRVELRENEIELIAETDHDREALFRLHGVGSVKVEPGRSIDQSWPLDLRKTNVVLRLPDPNDWVYSKGILFVSTDNFSLAYHCARPFNLCLKLG